MSALGQKRTLFMLPFYVCFAHESGHAQRLGRQEGFMSTRPKQNHGEGRPPSSICHGSAQAAGSSSEASSFSGLFTRVETGHIAI